MAPRPQQNLLDDALTAPLQVIIKPPLYLRYVLLRNLYADFAKQIEIHGDVARAGYCNLRSNNF